MIINSDVYLPPPPGQRPLSPPNIPPPILRNNIANSVNSKLTNPLNAVNFHNNRSTAINNSLLNSLLNSSLNQSDRKQENYDNSFNSSFNLLNNSHGSNSTHNNSVFNTTATTTTANASFLSNNVNNYHAMLISPNLRTLYDKKKQEQVNNYKIS